MSLTFRDLVLCVFKENNFCNCQFKLLIEIITFLWVTGRKTQVILEDKLKKLEEECKQKEAERVNLELELTEVKESLKKALAGGITLGLAIEPKSGTSSPQVCKGIKSSNPSTMIWEYSVFSVL